MGDTLLGFLGVLFLALVVSAFLSFAQGIVCVLLLPVNFAITSAVNGIIKPFRWLADKAMDGMDRISARLFKNRRHVPAFEAWGGLGQVLFAAMLLLVSVACIVCICLTREDAPDFIEYAVVSQLPPLFIIDLLSEETGFFEVESLVEMTLFNTLAILFMRRTDTLKEAVRIVYDTVYLFFCSLVVCLLPDSLYRLPTTLLERLMAVPGSEASGSPLVLFLLVPALLLAGYVTVAVLALAIREFTAAISFSLFPLSVMCVLVLLIDALAGDGLLCTVLYYAAAIGVTIWQGHFRIEKEDEYAASRAAKQQARLARSQQRKQKKYGSR